MSSANLFSVLEEGEEITEPVKKRVFTGENNEKINWADATDDEETQVSQPTTEVENIRNFDKQLSVLKSIEITHNVIYDDRKTGKSLSYKNLRVLRVSTKDYYDNLLKLIKFYKPIKSDGWVDFKTQKSKIDTANALLEICYKDPKIPCCFVYPIAVLETDEGETIIRNHIYKNYKGPVVIENMLYLPKPQ